MKKALLLLFLLTPILYSNTDEMIITEVLVIEKIIKLGNFNKINNTSRK